MKSKLLLSIIALCTFTFSFAQETTVNLSLGSGYVNQVYYKLNSQTQTDFSADSWDVAFLRTSNFDIGMYVNDAIGIQVYEAANTVSDWDNINISDQSSWTQLYNSDTERDTGAFMQGSATYGWGEYNVATHKVTGTIVFVLKYADETYKKFICEEFYGGYSIKYASWNGTTWGDDQTATISNSENTDNNYNYYSLQNNQTVVAEPAATDWDIVFRKYTTDVGGGYMYPVTGVLQADNVEVAKATGDDTTDLTYTTDINTIGYDWKTLNDSYTYDVNSDQKYYLKDTDGRIYKLYFTTFSGSSTGDVSFNFEDVTQVLGLENIEEGISFGVYPNPVTSNKKINVIFDVNATSTTDNKIEIFNLQGQKVLQTTLANSSGFYTKEINLNSLNTGVYMLKFTSGNYQKTKKIVIQ